MPKAYSIVKTADIVGVDSNVTLTIGNEQYSGEVHALDSIGVTIYNPQQGTLMFPWTSIDFMEVL